MHAVWCFIMGGHSRLVFFTGFVFFSVMFFFVFHSLLSVPFIPFCFFSYLFCWARHVQCCGRGFSLMRFGVWRSRSLYVVLAYVSAQLYVTYGSIWVSMYNYPWS